MARTNHGSRGWASRWRAWFRRKLRQARGFSDRHQVVDRFEKVEGFEIPGAVQEAIEAGGLPESVTSLAEEGLPRSYSDLAGRAAGLLPAGISKLAESARAKWAVVGLGWALFASWSHFGSPAGPDAGAAAGADLSAATREIAEEVGDRVSPLREAVEDLAGRLSEGKIRREDLPATLQGQGQGVDGLVDLTVAYNPYASPTGNRLDAPSYLGPEDRLVQREEGEDYATRAISTSPLPSWFGDPLARAAATWSTSSMTQIPERAEAEAAPAQATTTEGLGALLHFGSPFADRSAGSGFNGVVSASLSPGAISEVVDELAEKAGEDEVERVYLLAPGGHILHRAGGPAALEWAQTGFQMLGSGLADPTDSALGRWVGRLSSGESGQFSLADLAGSAANLARGEGPGWVEHTPVPGTDWTVAVLYSSSPEERRREQRARDGTPVGAGAFALLVAATLGAAAGGIRRSPPSEPPPFRDARFPGELDFPDPQSPPAQTTAAAGLAAAFDALNHRLLNEVGSYRTTASAPSVAFASQIPPSAPPAPGRPATLAPAAPPAIAVAAANGNVANPGAGGGAEAAPANNPAGPPAQADPAPVLELAVNSPGGDLVAMLNPRGGAFDRSMPFLPGDANNRSISDYLGIGAGFGGGIGGIGGGGFLDGPLPSSIRTQYGPSLGGFHEYRPGSAPPPTGVGGTAVPEPSTLVLCLSGAALALVVSRRWRRGARSAPS